MHTLSFLGLFIIQYNINLSVQSITTFFDNKCCMLWTWAAKRNGEVKERGSQKQLTSEPLARAFKGYSLSKTWEYKRQECHVSVLCKHIVRWRWVALWKSVYKCHNQNSQIYTVVLVFCLFCAAVWYDTPPTHPPPTTVLWSMLT